MDFLTIKNENLKEFESIAVTLFDKYVVETKEAKYRLTEIEFYWDSENHKDACTYKRHHIIPKTGEWFFHYSGVDIALENEKLKGYGGILIRSIYNINTKTITKGPLVCAMKLFSGMNAFAGSPCTRMVKTDEFKESVIQRNKRVGLGKNAIADDADKYEYNFTIDPRK